MPETKSIYLALNEKETYFSCCKQRFGQFASNLPPQQSKNSTIGLKLPFSVNSLGVNGLNIILFHFYKSIDRNIKYSVN